MEFSDHSVTDVTMNVHPHGALMSKSDAKAPDRYQSLGSPTFSVLVVHGAHGAIRTRDTRFRRAVLYPLSYVGLTRLLRYRGVAAGRIGAAAGQLTGR